MLQNTEKTLRQRIIYARNCLSIFPNSVALSTTKTVSPTNLTLPCLENFYERHHRAIIIFLRNCCVDERDKVVTK